MPRIFRRGRGDAAFVALLLLSSSSASAPSIVVDAVAAFAPSPRLSLRSSPSSFRRKLFEIRSSVVRNAPSVPDAAAEEEAADDDDADVAERTVVVVAPSSFEAADAVASAAEVTANDRRPSGDDEDEGAQGDDDDDPYRLELDSEGRLLVHRRSRRRPRNEDDDDRSGPSVPPVALLDGLTSDAWSVAAPRRLSSSSTPSSGLFLEARHEIPSSVHRTTVGRLVSVNRILALSRINRYWMGPKFGTDGSDVPVDTQFLLLELDRNGPYGLMLPLVDDGFRASLERDEQGGLGVTCHAESGDDRTTSAGKMKALYVSVGDDPFELLRTGVKAVSKTLGTFRTLSEKRLPNSVEEFGWCTWDAFYSRVDPRGVLEGVETLRRAGFPPRNVILDDGWQTVDPAPPPPSPPPSAPSKTSVVARAIDASGAAVGKAVSRLYDDHVKNAKHKSFPNKVWRALSRTILKRGLWKYFDSETDFNRQLSSFEPNAKFRSTSEEGGKGKGDDATSGSKVDLKTLVSRLKKDLGVRKVYAWHALHGYWRGVSPALGSKHNLKVRNVRPKPSDHLLQVEPQLAWDTVSLFGVGLMTDKNDLRKFYSLLHGPLVEAGVDGVKVDVQSGVSAAGGGVGGGPHLAELYTTAMEESVSRHFSAAAPSPPRSSSDDIHVHGDDNVPAPAVDCINCMCHSTENLYRYSRTSVARASDDFYPDRPSSHTIHVVNVAYNSLFLGEICLPDWDMFHSHHETASLHGAARAVGGCPVYVSDEPGKHGIDVLRRLVLPDGTVLRAKNPGRPTRDCLFEDVTCDGVTALKIWNVNGNAEGKGDARGGGKQKRRRRTTSGVIGSFHVQGVSWNFDRHDNEIVNEDPVPITSKIKPNDVEPFRNVEDGPFAVWSHASETLTVVPNGESEVTTILESKGWEIYTIVPVERTTVSTSEEDEDDDGLLSFCPIGLVDMYNSGGAVLDFDLESSSTTKTTKATVVARGPGKFASYADRSPSRVFLEQGGDDATTSSSGGGTTSSSPFLSSDLPFLYDDETNLLTFVLPDERKGETEDDEDEGAAPGPRPHRVTIVWDDGEDVVRP